jgi:hypothetical protein
VVVPEAQATIGWNSRTFELTQPGSRHDIADPSFEG